MTSRYIVLIKFCFKDRVVSFFWGVGALGGEVIVLEDAI